MSSCSQHSPTQGGWSAKQDLRCLGKRVSLARCCKRDKERVKELCNAHTNTRACASLRNADKGKAARFLRQNSLPFPFVTGVFPRIINGQFTRQCRLGAQQRKRSLGSSLSFSYCFCLTPVKASSQKRLFFIGPVCSHFHSPSTPERARMRKAEEEEGGTFGFLQGHHLPALMFQCCVNNAALS